MPDKFELSRHKLLQLDVLFDQLLDLSCLLLASSYQCFKICRLKDNGANGLCLLLSELLVLLHILLEFLVRFLSFFLFLLLLVLTCLLIPGGRFVLLLGITLK